jgi:hypothetical protein
LRQAGGGQHEEEADEPEHGQPPMRPTEPFGVEWLARDARDDVVGGPPHREGHESQQRHVRVSDAPVGEVDVLVEAPERLQRALDAHRYVPERPSQREPQGNRVIRGSPRPSDGHEDVHDERHHGDEQADPKSTEITLSHSHRRLKDVVRTDGGVEERKNQKR